MKHISLFEEFIKNYGEKISHQDFENLAVGTAVKYRGTEYTIEKNNKVALVLKPVSGGNPISVNLSQFIEFGIIK